MVYVSHHGNDGCARQQVVLVVDFFSDSLLNLCAHIFGLEAKLIGNQVDGLGIQPLIDRCHHTNAHQGSNQFVDIDIHHRSQFANCHEFGELQYLTFLTFCPCFRTHAFLYGITFFLTISSTFLVLRTLTGESGQRFLYLACYLFLVHLQRFLVTSSVLSIFLISISSVSIPRLIASAIVTYLLRSGINVHSLLIDAYPLFASTISLFLTFSATFFLAFLLGTSTLVDGAEVYFSQHVHLGRILQTQLTLGLEDFVSVALRFFTLLRFVNYLWRFTFLRLNTLVNLLFLVHLRLLYNWCLGLDFRFLVVLLAFFHHSWCRLWCFCGLLYFFFFRLWADGSSLLCRLFL